MSAVLKNKKILIIDDEPGILDIVREILNRTGAKPYTANNLESGLHTVRFESIDAILLDRYMPEGDGLEFLKRLKATPETKTLPVIMLTGEKDMIEIKKSLEAGAVGYIGKPFTPKTFLGQLEKILNNKVELDSSD